MTLTSILKNSSSGRLSWMAEVLVVVIQGHEAVTMLTTRMISEKCAWVTVTPSLPTPRLKSGVVTAAVVPVVPILAQVEEEDLFSSRCLQ